MNLPPLHLALLDEDGYAHVRCNVCQTTVTVPYLTADTIDVKPSNWLKIGKMLRNGSWLIGIVFLLVAIAMVATLLPISMEQKKPPKQSPSFSPEEYVIQPFVNISIAFRTTGSPSGVATPIASMSGTMGLPSSRTPLIVT